jgi:hypothetical protein
LIVLTIYLVYLVYPDVLINHFYSFLLNNHLFWQSKLSGVGQGRIGTRVFDPTANPVAWESATAAVATHVQSTPPDENLLFHVEIQNDGEKHQIDPNLRPWSFGETEETEETGRRRHLPE